MTDGTTVVPAPARNSRVDPWVISADTDTEIAFLAAVAPSELSPPPT